MRILPAAFLAILFFSNCKSKNASKDESKDVQKADSTTITTGSADKEAKLLQVTGSVMLSLRNKDYALLATHIHPEQGVRFSPYGSIDTVGDIVMRPDELVRNASADNQPVRTWGEFDGTGDPILMTFNEYMGKFVYDVDFSKPEVLKVNGITNPGNAMNNITVAYPGSDFTDSHFSGFDKKYEGMDWRSLRLVFKLISGQYYLVGIVHDQWTI